MLRRAIYLDPSVWATTRTLASTTLANPSHNSRFPHVHRSSRATTQEISLWAITQGIRSESQLKEHSTSQPLRYHQSLVDHAHPKHPNRKPCLCIIAWHCSWAARWNTLPDHLTGDTCRQVLSAYDATVCRYRLAGQPSPPGATRFQSPLWL